MREPGPAVAMMKSLIVRFTLGLLPAFLISAGTLLAQPATREALFQIRGRISPGFHGNRRVQLRSA